MPQLVTLSDNRQYLEYSWNEFEEHNLQELTKLYLQRGFTRTTTYDQTYPANNYKQNANTTSPV